MSFRAGRLAEGIKREVTDIMRNLKDPRIASMTSLTGVEVTRDMRYARLFISVYGTEEEQQMTLEGLQSASGFIRQELGKRIRLRHLPELSFSLDSSIQHGIRISRILDEVLDENRKGDQ